MLLNFDPDQVSHAYEDNTKLSPKLLLVSLCFPTKICQKTGPAFFMKKFLLVLLGPPVTLF
jgi:hypothetical protein